MTLSAFAERTAERTWHLSMASLLAGMAGGRRLDELHLLLDGASQGPVPETVTRLLADAAERGSALSDRGVVRLVECSDPATAALVACHPRTAAYCRGPSRCRGAACVTAPRTVPVSWLRCLPPRAGRNER